MEDTSLLLQELQIGLKRFNVKKTPLLTAYTIPKVTADPGLGKTWLPIHP
jgi:hypothetical protein